MSVGVLLPESLAKEGLEFVFKAPSSVCETCPAAKMCAKRFEEERRYRVVEVIDRKTPGTSLSCPLTGERLVSVMVESNEFVVCIDKSRAVPKMTFTFDQQPCTKISCPYWKYCNYRGIPRGVKVEVVKVLDEKIECPQGKVLKKVILRIKE